MSAIMISTQYKAPHTNRRKMNFKRWDIQKLHKQKITKSFKSVSRWLQRKHLVLWV